MHNERGVGLHTSEKFKLLADVACYGNMPLSTRLICAKLGPSASVLGIGAGYTRYTIIPTLIPTLCHSGFPLLRTAWQLVRGVWGSCGDESGQLGVVEVETRTWIAGRGEKREAIGEEVLRRC